MSHKLKILAIGAATQDVFLQGKVFKPHREEDGDYVEEFELGSKNDVEEITFTTGGGATNAAVTFARQELDSHYMGSIGHDVAGQAVLDDLHRETVDTSLVYYSSKHSTGYSAILLAPNGERTILTYRGASHALGVHADNFHQTKPDWLYISSLSGDFASLEVIMHYAKQHGIKVAINPGKGELEHRQALKDLMPYIHILSVNKEEMEMLYGAKPIHDLMRDATQHVPVVVVTDGPKGVIASDGQKLYTAGMYEDVKVVDRLGAGDAFSSGFTAMAAQGEPMERAITFASANSTSVVTKIGAKAGILHAHAHINDMPIEVVPL